jgi:hypothetical protein
MRSYFTKSSQKNKAMHSTYFQDWHDSYITTTSTPSKVQSGVTSVFLDTETLKSAAGLTLSGTDGTVTPIGSQYNAGFAIQHDSTLTYNNENGFTPLGGTIEHTGTVSFDTDVLGKVTVGDFSVGYDANRKTDKASGFYVKDIAGTGAILFDVSNPHNLAADSDSLNISGADLLVSAEFNGFLNEKGLAHTNLTGADVGDVAIDAISAPVGNDIFGSASSFSYASCG